MDKARIREIMLALEEDALQEAHEHYETYVKNAQVDKSDGYDSDEVSRAFFAGQLAGAFDSAAHEHQEKLAFLQDLNFEPKTEVEPGAVVKFGNCAFVVSVATKAFEVDGQHYIGLSTSAPIYDEIEGLQAGDEFEFNGNKSVIREIF